MKIGIYHSRDLDGWCCAAIYMKANPDACLHGWDYGDPIPWELIKGNDVTLMDISFQPWPEMIRLCEEAASVTWIDHHTSAMQDYRKNPMSFDMNFNVSLDTSKAACELCWRYYFPDEPMPQGVFLLSDYDCWRHSDTRTHIYHSGAKLWLRDPVKNPPNQTMWDRVLSDDLELKRSMLYDGGKIMDYESIQNETAVLRLWFKVEFEGYSWMAVNQGGINSRFWDAVWSDNFDGKLAFVWSNECWTVSLYSDKIDCSAIAKKYGGGGHKGAAGFQCHTLPFSKRCI